MQVQVLLKNPAQQMLEMQKIDFFFPPCVLHTLYFSVQAAGHDESVPHSSPKPVLTVDCFRELMSSLEKKPFLLCSFLLCFFFQPAFQRHNNRYSGHDDGPATREMLRADSKS